MTLESPATFKRHLIDWHQPPLPATADWLRSQWSVDNNLDMSGVILVLPTSRAGRCLTEQLVRLAEQHDLLLTPPEITTIGSVPEMLYQPSRPLASPLVQLLAWVKALRATPHTGLRQFTRLIPEPDDSLGWHSLAGLLNQWHQELATHALVFEDVLNMGNRNELFPERERWTALCTVQRRYLDELGDRRLWDRQTARLMAVENRECRLDRHLVLIGMVDLNPVIVNMLEQVADNVTSVVFGDPLIEEGFDYLGCLNSDYWVKTAVHIPDACIRQSDQPADQARTVVELLRETASAYAIDEIGVTIPDPRLVSPIRRALSEQQISMVDSGGSSIGNTRPFILLELLSGWLRSETFDSFARLVRHPDLYAWLSERTKNHNWLGELDQYQNNRLPFYIFQDANAMYFGGKDYKGRPLYANLERAWQEIHELIQPVAPAAKTRDSTGKPLSHWARPWRQILVAIYRDQTLDRSCPEDRKTIRACQSIVQALIQIETVGDLAGDPAQSAEAIQWALELCHSETVADPVVPDAINATGWLDTPWDDAPVAIVTGFNDGWIPSSENSSLFLPNSIRSQLGLIDNHRRYARDAWATQLLLASRKQVWFIAGRRDEDGQPLLPSRLLLTGSAEVIARRAKWLFEDTGSVARPVETSGNRPRLQQLVIPVPATGGESINSMRVTDFKVYLLCPYRFYLTRVLGLNRLSDDQDELDGAQFGRLLHDVVENFGRSEFRHSDDRQMIEAAVVDCLDRFALARYGREPVPAVSIQLEQARLRLAAFAKWQSEHRRQGYEIFEVEREKTNHVFDLDGQPFEIRGQIDRIDVNHSERKIGIYDYKTNDLRRGPRAYHQDRDGNWTDFQLPLYRSLVKQFDLPGDYTVKTGLILLARDTSRILLEEDNWTPGELEAADEQAFEVMRQVRAGIFWPPRTKQIPVYMDDLAAICQSRVFQQWEPSSSTDASDQSRRGPHFPCEPDSGDLACPGQPGSNGVRGSGGSI